MDLPYVDGDKESILRDAMVSCDSLGVDFDTVFRNTNTSYSPDQLGRSSGRTGADVERILAFHAIGRKDPVEYVEDWSTVLERALATQKEYEAAI
jgi:7-cyano-7-deazaguanine synthase